MIECTLYSEGKNDFVNNVFSSNEWSAPFIVSPTEIQDRINSMNLVGRIVEDVRIMGLSYWHTEFWIEDSAYNSLPDSVPEEEKQRLSQYDNISEELDFARFVHIDEPFMIKFCDGDIFEIDTPQTPEYRFSMNCIPWYVKPQTKNNIDASIFFSTFLKQKIVEVEVTKEYTDTDPMIYAKFDETGTKKEIVIRIVLWLENNIGICISGWYDFCDIACIDRNNEVVPIKFGELKKSLHN